MTDKLKADPYQMYAVRPEAFLDYLFSAMAMTYDMEGDTAVIKVKGALYSYDSLIAVVKAADKDEEVKSIRLNVDSPGGALAGVYEAAMTIKNTTKPIHTRVTGDSCSAAYLLSAATDSIEAYPTSIIGSVGVVTRKDPTGQGTVLRSKQSPKKCLDPSTPEGEAEEQIVLDDAGAEFIKILSTLRDRTEQEVEEGYGQGGVFIARKALEAGMIDKILSIEPITEESQDMAEDKEKVEPTEEEEVTPEEETEEVEEEAVAEEDSEEKSPEDIIKEKDEEIAKLKEELDKLKEEDEPEEEEAKAEDSEEVKALKAQLEEASLRAEAEQVKVYEAERKIAIDALKASGKLLPADEEIAVLAYDTEQRGEGDYFTKHYANRQPVVKLKSRLSHNGSTEAAAIEATREPTVHEQVIKLMLQKGWDINDKSKYKAAWDMIK